MKPKITRKEYNLIAKERGIEKPQNMSKKELLNTLIRYDSKRKVKKICKKLLKLGQEKIAEIQNILNNELNQVKEFQKKSIDELKQIAGLRRIKNTEKLTKEELIVTLLKSESSFGECNFEKLLNNGNITDDDTYDDKVRGEISDIRMIVNRLGNIVITEDRKEKDIKEILKKGN